MSKIALWYNGEKADYEVLNFSLINLTNEQIINKCEGILYLNYGFSNKEIEKEIENIYIIDDNNMKKLKVNDTFNNDIKQFTYRDLLGHLQTLDEEQLNSDVTIYDNYEDEFYTVNDI